MIIDRDCNKICVISSLEGGMDIEVIAANSPDKIVKKWIDPFVGLRSYHVRDIHRRLHLHENLFKEFLRTVTGLYEIFIKNHVSLIEINPLAISSEGLMIALDAKIVFDDNATFKLGNIKSFEDERQENSREVSARANNLSYIALDGNIGCLVNGAGLAMSTMDIIKYVGGEPANFLDV